MVSEGVKTLVIANNYLLADSSENIEDNVSLGFGSVTSQIENTCLMLGKCSPYLASQGKNVTGWVICEVCQSWYHSVCVGLCTEITNKDFHFTCCVPPSKNEVYV